MTEIEKSFFNAAVDENISTAHRLKKLYPDLAAAVRICTNALADGCKIIFCGNGGSAADSQHLSAEFVGRFLKERKALAAISLATDTSALTCIGNDYDFSKIFSRQLEGIGNAGDVLIGISTSGNSENVIRATQVAKEMQILTIIFTGENPSKLSELSDVCLHVPSKVTARIQEAHILLGHILCASVENRLEKMKLV